MPSSSHIHKSASTEDRGCLYVVATPMGNLADITLRALEVLQSVDIVAAEDTRKTGRMLAHHQIQKPLISYYEHNEKRRSDELISRLKQGQDIALVSDAGTPAISDPGYRLVSAAVKADVRVIPIPGVSALTTALSAAGLPTDGFVFAGFAPKRQGRRRALLERLADSPFTNIFYESPLRIVSLLGEIREVMGDRECVVAREMTKFYEEFLRGPVSEVIETLSARQQVKGECTVLIAGYRDGVETSWEDIQNAVLEGISQREQKPADLAKTIAERFGIPKKKAYDEILRQKGK